MMIHKASIALGGLAKICDKHGGTEFAKQLKARTRKTPRPLPTDAELMRLICVAIAYSQGSRSKEVGKLIETKLFSQALCSFNIRKLAGQDPTLILKRHWHKLGHIRFRGKLKSMVKCAQVLETIGREYGSFADYLGRHHIPRRIRSQDEFDQFWNGFELLKQDLGQRKMPFFRSTTSLLQLLLDLDYDSVKPDLIVMRLAKRLGMVPKETGDRNLRKAVKTIQIYCLGKPIRASAVDLMMLAVGGQTGSRKLLNKGFCPPKGYCHQRACGLGTNGYCSAYRSV